MSPRLQPLDKKFLRDLWRMKLQALAIVFLIGAGVAVTVMAYNAEKALRSARDGYYRSSRFADMFVTIERAPLSVARRAAAISGVTAVDPRIVVGGLSLLPGLSRPAQIRLISLPDREDAALNRIVVRRGRLPAPDALNEAVGLQSFLDAAGLAIGDDIVITVKGRLIRLRIVGSALSSEFIYVPDAASVMPDDAHNGVVWVTRKALEGAANMQGAHNALSLTIAPGTRPQSVESALDRLYAPYGAQPVLRRLDQPSHAFLEGELKELQRSGLVFPPIFLIVAGALVHMTLLRLTEVQREEIGLLKAFGYTNAEAARPFAMMALVIGLLGAALGASVGIVLAGAITGIYAHYMRFPTLEPSFNVGAFALAGSAGLAAALSGAVVAVGNVARLSPAEAMAPERPATFQTSWFEKSPGGESLGILTRSIARSIERRLVRSTLTVFGLASSIALLLGTQFLFGALTLVLDHTFFQRQRFNHQIAFASPRGRDAADEIRAAPGVMAVQLARTTIATMSYGARQTNVNLTGLNSEDPFLRPLDSSGALLPIKPHGMILTAALARKLGVTPGETVSIRLHERHNPTVAVSVNALATEYSGLGAYIDRRLLNRLIGEGDLSNAALVIVDPQEKAAFYRWVSATPGVMGAQSRDDVINAYRTVIAEAFRTSRTYYALFAAIIAFGVAYNAGRIALSERSRDLATLEVLGFTHREIAIIHLGEQAVLALSAIPVGLGLGWLLAHGIALAYQRDEMRIPPVIDMEALRTTLLVYVVTVVAVFILIGYRLWRLDLVAVLKTRE